MPRGCRHGHTVPALWHSTAGTAGTHGHVERGRRAAARHRDQVVDGAAAGLAAVALRRPSLCGCGDHALAAAVGHGCYCAVGFRRGLEREVIMNPFYLWWMFLRFYILCFLVLGSFLIL